VLPVIKKDFDDELKKNGLKNTKHRETILEILDKSPQPLPVEDIFGLMRDKNIRVNLSTVYRTLETLCEKNLVTKLNFEGDGRTLFEYNRMIHRHYLICLGCKKIVTLDYCPLEGYEKALADKTDFMIAGHKLDVYGYCPECRKKLSAAE
jgi:Fur family ferric uptake transcriptional regulator